MEIVLPVSTKPLITTYNHHALNMEPVVPVGAYTAGGHFVGLEACEKLSELLKTDMRNGSRIELRPFYLLRDHNRVMLERMKMLAGGNEEGELLIKRYGECVKNYEIFLMKLIKCNLSNASEQEMKTAGDFAVWYCAEKEYIYQFILLLEK